MTSETPDLGASGESGSGPAAPRDGDARLLFRYLAFEEWRDYRAILSTFAGTFFAEFSPDEVAERLATAGADLDPAVVSDRLDRLCQWGNLTTSASVGNPASLADYYRRRNRYLITRAGQEVHDVVEGVLTRVDEVRDVSTGRLRQMQEALVELAGTSGSQLPSGIIHRTPAQLADAIRAVFDPHVAFTSEITQFFAAVNQWQSRYDLSADEFRFFAEVLIGYVSERLDEIHRMVRPIGELITAVLPHAELITQRASTGLAARVEEAGLGSAIVVSRSAGGTVDDWHNLARWFVGSGLSRSRLDRLRHDAIAAIRTLTLNLTRLSAVGLGVSSRRSDLLRLAGLFASRTSDADAHLLAAAAFGLFPSNHLGRLAEDADDPVATSTAWSNAPKAMVPVSIRERGDSTNRGSATPLRDRHRERLLVQQRRQQARDAERRVDAELLALGRLDGATVSVAALARLQQLLARTTFRTADDAGQRRNADGGLECTVAHRAGASTTIHSPHGTLTFHDLEVSLAEPPTAELSGVR